MPVIDETVVIARPAEEVFDFLVVAENLPRWDSSILECVQVGSEAVSVGARYRGASKWGTPHSPAILDAVERARTHLTSAARHLLSRVMPVAA